MNSDFGIVSEKKLEDGRVHLDIDAKKAHYKGTSWNKLTDYHRRKFETLLIITRPQERLHVSYINQ